MGFNLPENMSSFNESEVEIEDESNGLKQNQIGHGPKISNTEDGLQLEDDWTGLGLNLDDLMDVFWPENTRISGWSFDQHEVEPEKEKQNSWQDWSRHMERSEDYSEDEDEIKDEDKEETYDYLEDVSESVDPSEEEEEDDDEEEDIDEIDDEDKEDTDDYPEDVSEFRRNLFRRLFSKFANDPLEMNTLLKGILFVQEMYNEEESDMETIYSQEQEKYQFMFERGDQSDRMMFQGSTAEGLAIYKMKERGHEGMFNNLRWARHFDYDLMYIKNQEVVDENSVFGPSSMAYVAANSKGGEDVEGALALWKEAKFCKHELEPLVMMKMVDKNDSLGLMAEYVDIRQPGCNDCADPNKAHDYNGRVMKVINGYRFWDSFQKRSYKRPNDDQNHDCDQARLCEFSGVSGENFNRYGDLCMKCRRLNSTIVDHDDGAISEIHIDSVINAGPSVKFEYHINHKGPLHMGLPLFNDPGVSTVDVDTIPALQYPLMDWEHWGVLLRTAGVQDLPTPLHLSWPYECLDFTAPRSKTRWPSLLLRHEVMKAGCQLVPRFPRRLGEKGPKTWLQTGFRNIGRDLWRISFSLSEKLLTKSFNQAQRRCFLLLKVLLKGQGVLAQQMLDRTFDDDKEQFSELIDDFKFKVSSFMLKHVMFWTLEEVDQDEWRMNNLYACILHVLDKLYSFLETNCVPHYFFGRRNNLMAGAISEGGWLSWERTMTSRYGDTSADQIKLFGRSVNMMVEIKALKDHLREVLVGCVKHGHLDFQWDQACSLHSTRLVKTFNALLKQQSGITKEAVIDHHRTMIKLIEQAPRKYGRGVNLELLEFLKTELEILRSDSGSLEALDQMETEKMKKVEHSVNMEPCDKKIDSKTLKNFKKLGKLAMPKDERLPGGLLHAGQNDINKVVTPE